jgi:hypothetical protein
MEGMQEYQQLLANSMNEYNSKVSNAKEEYQTKLASVDAVKDQIEKATDTLGGIMITDPITQLIKKGVTKTGREEIVKGGSEILNRVGEKLKPYTQQPTQVDSGSGTAPTTEEQEYAQRLSTQGQEGTSEAIEMETRGVPAEAETSFGAEVASSDPATSEIIRQSGSQEAGMEATQSGQDAVVENADQVASDVGSAADSAGVDAVEGIAGALDLDPFTAFLGLLIGGVGAIVGGVEGANSIKNPAIPKPPPLANTSVQLGVGGR